jgi:hypothetical protein
MLTDDRVLIAGALLQARAADVDHPGGTLLDHLHRVRQLLGEWGAEPDVRLAGLCHAAYGTDGFPTALLRLDERSTLANVIGAESEQLVYLYGSCDRGHVYPQLGEPAVDFVDRFTGARSTPARPALRAFVEITAANELDVVRHNAELANQYGASLTALFARAGRHLSPAARKAWASRATLSA